MSLSLLRSCIPRSLPWALVVSVLVALVLRLVVWHWHTFYPLGGDEQEYLNQALTLLREHRYEELRLMRPPLYGVFLAGCIVLVDSLVQRLRLVQALLSTATVLPMWLLTRELTGRETSGEKGTTGPGRGKVRSAPTLAALLCALSYTLAAHATELLTETLFLFGLTTLFWLLVRAASPSPSPPSSSPHQERKERLVSAGAAGVVLGLVCLVRSVALPLLVLGALWLLLAHLLRSPPSLPSLPPPPSSSPLLRRFLPSALFVLGVVLVVFPWALRNYATYGSVILIDTTGAENLWLDNDPAGREAVKAQLYAYGDDRAGRQRLAMRSGVETILSHPHHVLRKAWEEGTAFFALEYTDDMRDRPAIWVPPAEVWTRLLLGDGLFLVVLLGGVAGLWPGRWGGSRGVPWLRALTDPRWLMGGWVLYLFLTAMLFHVELRYRLPLYPALLPYAAITLARVGSHGTRLPRGGRSGLRSLSRLMVSRHIRGMMVRLLVLLLHPAMLVLYATLLHAPYPSLAWSLGQKHVHLARAAHALGEGNPDAARTAAHAALEQDARSVLARVALARAELLCGDQAGAERILREAIDMLPAHPYPHLLIGDLLRQRGDDASAQHELAYETASLQDLQAWSWQRMSTPPPSRLDIGGGLDLGMIGGVHARRAGTHWRWTTGHARLRLAVPTDASSPLVLRLRLASGRPEGAPPPLLRVLVNGQTAGEFLVSPGWNTYAVALPRSLSAGGGDTLIIALRSDTFAPRDYDPASSDGRTLGVMVDWAAVGDLEE